MLFGKTGGQAEQATALKNCQTEKKKKHHILRIVLSLSHNASGMESVHQCEILPQGGDLSAHGEIQVTVISKGQTIVDQTKKGRCRNLQPCFVKPGETKQNLAVEDANKNDYLNIFVLPVTLQGTSRKTKPKKRFKQDVLLHKHTC